MPEDASQQTSPTPSRQAPPQSILCFGVPRHRDPVIFSGADSSDVEDWLTTYERVSAHNKWDDPAKLRNLLFYLTVVASLWYNNHETDFPTWSSLKTYLVAVFSRPAVSKLREESCLRRNEQQPVEVQRVLALPGSQARLPCDLGGSFSASSLEPSLISWTRGPSATAEPLYSVARAEGVALVQADHRVTPAWKERFHFSVSRGTLSLADVSPRDAGLYVCRVRFQHAVERTSRVELVVVEHPGTPVLKFDPDSPGADRLREGQRLRVLCEVVGGKPRPSLRWSLSLSGGSQPTPLEATEGSSDARDGVTRSWATLDKLQRWHHEARLTCQAFNSELVASPTSSLRLQLELKPAQVRIKGSRSPVSADVEAVIECETTGSQPPANISWRLEETPLREAQVLARGANGTASLLRWTPRPQDNGRRLICLALNDRFPEDGIDDVWSLDVHYSSTAIVSPAVVFVALPTLFVIGAASFPFTYTCGFLSLAAIYS
ncbi:hemicentin-1-like [Dermacentor variabilis]|uniref:hemicentin-1-like n=1 Tax=Dermacentor variabilis TaxID=34621 RepID=UPI003F5B420F